MEVYKICNQCKAQFREFDVRGMGDENGDFIRLMFCPGCHFLYYTETNYDDPGLLISDPKKRDNILF